MRIIALILAVLISLQAPSTGSVLAEKGDTVTLINPGFEESDTETKPGWGNNNPSQISIDTTKSHSGKNSLKIVNTKNDHPWIKQQVWELEENAIYELGAWVNVDIHDTTKGGIGFKIEQYDRNNASVLNGSEDGPRFNLNTNGRWVYHSIRFQVQPGAYKIALYVRSYTLGTVWYDDITLTNCGGPEPYSFFADHVFHYPDEEKGTAVVSLDPFYEADGAEATDVSASFYFKDGETVLDKKENVKLVDREASYSYPVSIMKEKKKRYVLKTQLRKENGEVVREWSENMYLYDRPALMPENGKFIIDDKPFYPVIGYHAEVESYPYLADSGINTVMIGIGIVAPQNQKDWMPKLAKAGLRGIACLYPGMKPAFHPNNVQNSINTMNALKDDPNVIGWSVMDEPMGSGENMEEMKKHLEESYIRIREIDPTRPVYLLDYGQHRETIKYCDVFVADVYQRGDSASGVSQIIEPLTKNHPRVSTFELAATFESGGVFPPLKTIRASVYRGLEAGGSYGTGYYSISDAIGQSGGTKTPLYELDVWDDIKTLSSEELPVLFRYYGGDGVHLWNRGKTGDLYAELLWETWYTDDGEMYFMAHNRGDKRLITKVSLLREDGKVGIGAFTAEPVGLTSGGTSGDGEINLILGKEDIVLYKIKPKNLRIPYEDTADLYASLYKEGSREIISFSAVRNTNNGINIPIPDKGEYVQVYAFRPGTLQPLGAEKKYTRDSFK